MKNILINLVKISLSAAILLFLFYQAKQSNVFDDLLKAHKSWNYLVLGFFCCLAGVVLTFIRWHLLNRALGLQIHWKDSLRIGFIGYLFNLAPVGGIVGGDLLKAWILAKEQETIDKQSQSDSNAPTPSRMPEALATVFTDRLFGLYALFLLAAIAIFVSGFDKIENSTIRGICYGTYAIAVAWTVLIGVILGPDYTGGKSIDALGRLPYVGKGLKKTILSIRMFQTHIKTLISITIMGLVIHGFFAACIFLTGAGLFDNMLPLEKHLVITPLSLSTGAIPLSIGPFEGVLDLFYHTIPLENGLFLKEGTGLVVALGYRFMTLIIAGFGALYYFTSRQEIQQICQQEKQNH